MSLLTLLENPFSFCSTFLQTKWELLQNSLSLELSKTFVESNNNKNTETIKFLCSYGRKILPRYTDDTLHYARGLTCVLAIDRFISFIGLCALPFLDSIFVNLFGFLWIINQNFLLLVVVTELMVKLGEFCGSSVNLRCQLLTGDLETLISIMSDDRLRHDGWRSYL